MPWVDEFSKEHPFPISYSKLKVACEGTWAEFKHAIDHPAPLGPAAQFSKLFHSVLFSQEMGEPIPEPEFNHRSPVGREEFRQWGAGLPKGALVVAVHHDPAWMIERLERSDLTILKGDDFDRARRMADSVRARAFWKENFPLGVAEQRGEVELEGCMVRFVPDLRVDQKGLIVDVKGCRDITAHGLAKAIFDYMWDIQGALYLKATEAIEGRTFDRTVIVAVRNEEPYLTVEREIPPDVLMFAWDIAVRKLQEYRACMLFGEWPGPDEDVKPINWKPWMVAQREELINVG